VFDAGHLHDNVKITPVEQGKLYLYHNPKHIDDLVFIIFFEFLRLLNI